MVQKTRKVAEARTDPLTLMLLPSRDILTMFKTPRLMLRPRRVRSKYQL